MCQSKLTEHLAGKFRFCHMNIEQVHIFIIFVTYGTDKNTTAIITIDKRE